MKKIKNRQTRGKLKFFCIFVKRFFRIFKFQRTKKTQDFGKSNISKISKKDGVFDENGNCVAKYTPKLFVQKSLSAFQITSKLEQTSKYNLNNPSFEIPEVLDEQFSNHDSCSENGTDDFNLRNQKLNNAIKLITKSFNGPLSEKHGIPTEIDFILMNFLSFSEFYVRKSSEVNVCDMFFSYLNTYCSEHEEYFSDEEFQQLNISKKN